MKRFFSRQMIHFLFFFSFYLAVSFYTMAFNNTAGWSLFFFLTFLFIIDLISCIPSIKNVSCEPLNEKRLCVNQKSEVIVTMSCHPKMWMPIPMLTVIFLEQASKEVAFFPLYRGKNERISFQYIPSHRGIFTNFTLIIKGTDFLNFISKETTCPVSGPFIVLPNPKKETALRLYEQLKLLSPIFQAILGQPTPIVRNLRNYQVGDSSKTIDWKQSSKRNELLVREYEHETEQKIRLVFYGVSHEKFEELLAIYYSFSQIIHSKFTVSETLLAENTIHKNRDSLFACLEPLKKDILFPNFTNEFLLIFAPEKTPALQKQLLSLLHKNELALIVFEENKLFLFWKNQKILLESEGDER